MKPDNRGRDIGRVIAKMALNGGANISAKFVQRFGLGEDIVTKRRSDIATIRVVFPNLEYDFLGHMWILVPKQHNRKQSRG